MLQSVDFWDDFFYHVVLESLVVFFLFCFFCPPGGKFFKVLITVAISGTYWNYFLKNILFTHRSTKILIWGPNNGPGIWDQFEIIFFKVCFFSARHRCENFGPLITVAVSGTIWNYFWEGPNSLCFLSGGGRSEGENFGD